jgi:hypothetical protein
VLSTLSDASRAAQGELEMVAASRSVEKAIQQAL